MLTKVKNDIIEIFRKFSMHKAMRKKMFHDLIGEINDYYIVNYVTNEFHEQHLKEQLNGWATHLTELKNSINTNSDYTKGFVDGINRSITELEGK